MLTKVVLENFTVFREIEIDLSPGLNVFIGANGVGKSHLLKLLYAVGEAVTSHRALNEKLNRVFLPSEERLGRLAHRAAKSVTTRVEVHRRDTLPIKFSFTNHAKTSFRSLEGLKDWEKAPLEVTFIPPKEILSSAPGFRSLYGSRYIHFSEVYDDLLLRAYRPLLRGPWGELRTRLISPLQKALHGRVTVKGEAFFLRSQSGELEFTLVAEGLRKLALLWLLIQNGTLLRPGEHEAVGNTPVGYVLFWDEPEANLNPKLYGIVVHVMLELTRLGTQVMIATHDYALLKEIDLSTEPEDQVRYHALFHDDGGEVCLHSATHLAHLEPNVILETFVNLYDREAERMFGGV